MTLNGKAESHMSLIFSRFEEYVHGGLSVVINFLPLIHDHKIVFEYNKRKVLLYYMYPRLIPGIFQIFVVM